jgi:hypothetical protein
VILDRADESGLPDAFASLRVERLTKPDGRQLLYYTFTDDEPAERVERDDRAASEPDESDV